MTGSHLGAGQAWREGHTAALPLHSLSSADKHGEQERLEGSRGLGVDLVLARLEASGQCAA